MYKCAFIINCNGSARGIRRTLNSISSDNAHCSKDIYIVIDKAGDLEETLAVELRKHPFHSRTNVLVSQGFQLERQILQETDADFFLCLGKKDELIPGALQKMLDLAVRYKETTVFGACRTTNLKTSWSHQSTDIFFNLPVEISSQVASNLLRTPLLSCGLMNRAFYESIAEATTPLNAVVTHDYVVRKFCERKRSKHDPYPIRNSRLENIAQIKPASFPISDLSQDNKHTDGAWIFGERQGLSMDDSAWALFTYCHDNQPDIDSYYVLNPNHEFSIPDQYQDSILLKESDGLRKKLENASYVLFNDSAIDCLNSLTEVSTYPNICFVYLTHGYLGYSPGVYQRDHYYIDYVICTSDTDVLEATTRWRFSTSKFLKSGLPRWDRLTEKSQASSQREILFCPTWRKSFESSMWSQSKDVGEDQIAEFKKSSYYQTIAEILSNEKLISLLSSESTKITLKLHFRLMPFIGAFRDIENNFLTIADPETDPRPISQLLQDAAVLITDYSSIMWDMMYMEKPVICFQNDKPEMLGERRIENYGIANQDLPFPVCQQASQLLESLEKIILRDYCCSKHEIAQLDRFIPRRDSKNCERAFLSIRDASSPNHSVQPTTAAPITSIDRKHPDSNSAQTYANSENDTSIGLISTRPLDLPGDIYSIEPDSWLEELENSGVNRLVIEPHANAKSSWSDYFFSVDNTKKLLEGAQSFARREGIDLSVSIHPALPYKKLLRNQLKSIGIACDEISISASPGSYDVTVIIPTFNNAELLHNSIDSVLDQQFHGSIEIVVVNDGSTDQTLKVLEKYEETHPCIRVISQSNARQGAARNNGILNARGNYITFLDADDVLPRDAISELFSSAIRENTNLAIGIVASCQQGGKNQRINQSYYHYAFCPSVSIPEEWRHVFQDPSCVGKLYKREFLIENSLFFPQSYHEDQAFCFSLFSNNQRFSVVKKIVYFYVARPIGQEKSGTQTFSSEKFRQIMLSGRLSKDILMRSTISEDVKDFGLGFLLLRYDRFMWKKRSSQESLEEQTTFLDNIHRLFPIISMADDVSIIDNCTYYPALFLAVKRQEFELAKDIYLHGETEALSSTEKRNLLPIDALNLRRRELDRGRYDYFSSVALNSTAYSNLNHVEGITEMSYGYRLGAIFVDSFKQPARWIIAPFDLCLLAFDMITKRGRKKQVKLTRTLLAQSPEAIEAHSRVVHSTAAYRLGVVLMEAMIGGPSKILRLPSNIKKLYRQTAP